MALLLRWGMARKRAAEFDPPSDAEALASPDLVLRGPKGGWMWKCQFCGRPAVHVGLSGRKVCKAHGGTTAAQRDPVKRLEAAQRGEVLRGPGRPLEHGVYARIPGYRVDEILERYRAEGVNPDDTDEDMLLLRAQLEELRDLRPNFMELHVSAALLVKRLTQALSTDLPEEGEEMTVDRFLIAIERMEEVEALIRAFETLAKTSLQRAKSIEDRHAKLILMAKVRADTRLKNAAAEQLDVFTVMVKKLSKINEEVLPANLFESLSLRYAQELNEVPKRAVAGVKA